MCARVHAAAPPSGVSSVAAAALLAHHGSNTHALTVGRDGHHAGDLAGYDAANLRGAMELVAPFFDCLQLGGRARKAVVERHFATIKSTYLLLNIIEMRGR